MDVWCMGCDLKNKTVWIDIYTNYTNIWSTHFLVSMRSQGTTQLIKMKYKIFIILKWVWIKWHQHGDSSLIVDFKSIPLHTWTMNASPYSSGLMRVWEESPSLPNTSWPKSSGGMWWHDHLARLSLVLTSSLHLRPVSLMSAALCHCCPPICSLVMFLMLNHSLHILNFSKQKRCDSSLHQKVTVKLHYVTAVPHMFHTGFECKIHFLSSDQISWYHPYFLKPNF